MNIVTLEIPENFEVDEAAVFRQEINALIEKGERHFILDFGKCKFIDSTGLGVMVSAYKKCVELEGSLRLQSINNENVWHVFELTRLDKIFIKES